MSSVVSQRYWDAGYANRRFTYDDSAILFKDLFGRYVKPGGTCLEVGCYPGRFLIYLAKHFGFEVSGIDLTPGVATLMLEEMRRENVPVGEIVQGDFLAWQTDRRFDLVCSFGFIEHFSDYQAVLEKHIELVKPGGRLLVTTPNFRGLQQLLHGTLDATNLERHVIAAMDPRRWASLCRRHGLRVLHAGHYGTFDFWLGDPAGRWTNRITHRLQRLGTWLSRRFDLPNALTSPYAVVVAERPAA